MINERRKRRISARISPVTPTPHLMHIDKTPAQSSFFTGSRIAKHST
ncbi:hypothetical protein [Streptomyces albipurpureus]|uniref:Transposase n=1 Tax=Streptomyces albipurpureus TaxID=2897419 RepID=A0ABT0UF10_9ACTN|nr:hypothetical protein [Streptomyces sp. CWNU-1]MCM2387184.1 hypothetical protein [Streptomyces sp. CWNU-1]